MAVLLQHRYSLPSLEAEVLKGADLQIYKAVLSSGEWTCSLQGVVLKSQTEYKGIYDSMDVLPISLVDFKDKEEAAVTTKHPGITYLFVPEQLVKEIGYIEYTGNEASPGHLPISLAAWFCLASRNHGSKFQVYRSAFMNYRVYFCDFSCFV